MRHCRFISHICIPQCSQRCLWPKINYTQKWRRAKLLHYLVAYNYSPFPNFCVIFCVRLCLFEFQEQWQIRIKFWAFQLASVCFCAATRLQRWRKGRDRDLEKTSREVEATSKCGTFENFRGLQKYNSIIFAITLLCHLRETFIDTWT